MLLEGFVQQKSFDVKSDVTLLTEFDTKINSFILTEIKKQFPDHAALGEEGGIGNFQSKYCWVFDPIDGTKSFVLGVPLCMIVLSLFENGKPILATAYDPFSKEFYHASEGEGAFCNGEKISVSTADVTKGITICAGAWSYKYYPHLKSNKLQATAIANAGYSIAKVATGKAAALIINKPSFYDSGALTLLIEEADGKVSTFEGDAISHEPWSKSIVVSNGVVHEELLKVIAEEKNV